MNRQTLDTMGTGHLSVVQCRFLGITRDETSVLQLSVTKILHTIKATTNVCEIHHD